MISVDCVDFGFSYLDLHADTIFNAICFFFVGIIYVEFIEIEIFLFAYNSGVISHLFSFSF